jgi:hypothetical protein
MFVGVTRCDVLEVTFLKSQQSFKGINKDIHRRDQAVGSAAVTSHACLLLYIVHFFNLWVRVRETVGITVFCSNIYKAEIAQH